MAEVYIKGLYHALEDLDRLTIDSAGILLDPKRGSWPLEATITQDDLSAVKDRKNRKTNEAENDIASILKYVESFSDTQSFAESTMASILAVSTSIPSSASMLSSRIWDYRVELFAKAMDKICRAAIPQDMKPPRDITSQTMSSILQRVETVEEFVERYDAWSGQPERTRASVELQMHSIQIAAANVGRYTPSPTADQIDEIKADIRRRRAAGPPRFIISAYPSTSSVQSSPANWNPTITALISLITLVSMVPGLIGWQYSSHTRGTVKDANFWFLVQSCLVQILGVVITVFALFSSPRLPKQPWNWAWAFVVTSIGLTAGSVPAYLYAPTEWSTLMAFLGSTAQMCVVLQAMFTIDQVRMDEQIKKPN
ncbi:hypothetical protein PV08_00210 [Exophiala spinifera]|uniref:Uncharacterized protein n=1 Tax=Exophiala spinifera TaxID=91928 RepID=A0A0D1YWG5_9EURO|nr:uncharacterized protein PV08_00210 [Exophiala spinifera]KIW19636.1 hypothetical protein PV08_00210 [Exophiala spinifera]